MDFAREKVVEYFRAQNGHVIEKGASDNANLTMLPSTAVPNICTLRNHFLRSCLERHRLALGDHGRWAGDGVAAQLLVDADENAWVVRLVKGSGPRAGWVG